MKRTVARIAAGVALAGAITLPAAIPATVSAQSCDPAYISHCVPPLYETGDLNCEWFYDQGLSMIQLADPSNDPHGLDGWNYVDDGWGCEGVDY